MAQTVQIEMNLHVPADIEKLAKSGVEFLGRNDKSATETRDWLVRWLRDPTVGNKRDAELRKLVMTLFEDPLPTSGLSSSLSPFTNLYWHMHLTQPVRVAGDEVILEDNRMEIGHFYQTDYHGHEYLIRKKDENVIDIYVVEE